MPETSAPQQVRPKLTVAEALARIDGPLIARPAPVLQALFDVDLATINRWLRNGTIPSFMLAGSRYVRRADLESILGGESK